MPAHVHAGASTGHRARATHADHAEAQPQHLHFARASRRGHVFVAFWEHARSQADALSLPALHAACKAVFELLLIFVVSCSLLCILLLFNLFNFGNVCLLRLCWRWGKLKLALQLRYVCDQQPCPCSPHCAGALVCINTRLTSIGVVASVDHSSWEISCVGSSRCWREHAVALFVLFVMSRV